ncbi:MAG: aminoacylase, partial [Gemmatimonadetes bacterium]|nr:aminoacylase [Gemmatimonadota bacterium]
MPRRILIPLLLLAAACGGPTYDVVIRGGTVYDGTGAAGIVADVAIQGDSIVAVGELGRATGKAEVDATGMAVAPGFINMLSWANESLIYDGKSQADIRQGVTLEVMGEGESMGPLSDTMKVQARRAQADITYDITWTTLGDYLAFLERKGIAPNVASFVGATTVRVHEIGYADRPPTTGELERMKALVAQAMEEGALGLGSSLIYAPAFYAGTDELVELARVVGKYHGMYISHMRSEGNRLLEATDELIHIAGAAGIPAEIYHLKAGGEGNWGKMDALLAKVDSARAAGLAITACMYPYTAGATGLDASMPPWVQEGGYDAWAARLRDPAIRRKVIKEMRTPSNDWENLLLQAGGADKVLLIGFKADSLKPLTGKTLAAVATMRGTSPEEAAMDLVIADGSRVGAAYFIISEDNITKQFARPWVSLCSDAESPAPEGPFLKSNPHPRAYGT